MDSGSTQWQWQGDWGDMQKWVETLFPHPIAMIQESVPWPAQVDILVGPNQDMQTHAGEVSVGDLEGVDFAVQMMAKVREVLEVTPEVKTRVMVTLKAQMKRSDGHVVPMAIGPWSRHFNRVPVPSRAPAFDADLDDGQFTEDDDGEDEYEEQEYDAEPPSTLDILAQVQHVVSDPDNEFTGGQRRYQQQQYQATSIPNIPVTTPEWGLVMNIVGLYRDSQERAERRSAAMTDALLGVFKDLTERNVAELGRSAQESHSMRAALSMAERQIADERSAKLAMTERADLLERQLDRADEREARYEGEVTKLRKRTRAAKKQIESDPQQAMLQTLLEQAMNTAKGVIAQQTGTAPAPAKPEPAPPPTPPQVRPPLPGALPRRRGPRRIRDAGTAAPAPAAAAGIPTNVMELLADPAQIASLIAMMPEDHQTGIVQNLVKNHPDKAWALGTKIANVVESTFPDLVKKNEGDDGEDEEDEEDDEEEDDEDEEEEEEEFEDDDDSEEEEEEDEEEEEEE